MITVEVVILISKWKGCFRAPWRCFCRSDKLCLLSIPREKVLKRLKPPFQSFTGANYPLAIQLYDLEPLILPLSQHHPFKALLRLPAQFHFPLLRLAIWFFILKVYFINSLTKQVLSLLIHTYDSISVGVLCGSILNTLVLWTSTQSSLLYSFFF